MNWFRSASISETDASAALSFFTVSSATPTLNSDGNQSYAGTAGDAFYAGGVQIETGTYPTSLIKTAGGTDSRSADQLNKSTDVSWIINDAFTFVVDYEVWNNGLDNVGIAQIHAGNTSNHVYLQFSVRNQHRTIPGTFHGATDQIGHSNSLVVGGRNKAAVQLLQPTMATACL